MNAYREGNAAYYVGANISDNPYLSATHAIHNYGSVNRLGGVTNHSNCDHTKAQAWADGWDSAANDDYIAGQIILDNLNL